MNDTIDYDDLVSSSFLPGQWHRVKTSQLPYLTLSDVESIYLILNSSSNGLRKFSEAAKEIATKAPYGKLSHVYQFKNENALFELFEEKFSKELTQRGIDSWGRLMQYIS